MQIGPLQLIAIGFTDPQLDGSILTALNDAASAGHIRVVDAIGVYKDEYGTILAAQASDLTEKEVMAYGAWIGALVGLGAGGEKGAKTGAIAGAVAAAEQYEYGIGQEEIAAIAESIPAGGAALLLAVEHTWAIPLRDAVLASGGMVLAQDFLSPLALVELGVLAAG